MKVNDQSSQSGVRTVIALAPSAAGVSDVLASRTLTVDSSPSDSNSLVHAASAADLRGSAGELRTTAAG